MRIPRRVVTVAVAVCAFFAFTTAAVAARGVDEAGVGHTEHELFHANAGEQAALAAQPLAAEVLRHPGTILPGPKRAAATFN